MAPYLLAVASVSLGARTPGLTRHWPGSGTDREADSPGSTSPWGAVFLIDGSTQLVWDLQDPREASPGSCCERPARGVSLHAGKRRVRTLNCQRSCRHRGSSLPRSLQGPLHQTECTRLLGNSVPGDPGASGMELLCNRQYCGGHRKPVCTCKGVYVHVCMCGCTHVQAPQLSQTNLVGSHTPLMTRC